MGVDTEEFEAERKLFRDGNSAMGHFRSPILSLMHTCAILDV
jgi:hypothetical protein